MSATDNENDVGYCKTPKHTRWKKGQCGNPGRQRPQNIPSIADMIDDQLAKIASVKKRGVSRRLSIFEIILLRLFPEIATGNKRATRIHRKYQAYAQAHPSVIYEPAGNPEAMAAEYEQLLQQMASEPMTKEEAEYHEAFSQLTPIEASEIYRETLRKANAQWERDHGK